MSVQLLQIVMLRTVRCRQEARVFGGKRRIDSAVEQTALVSGRWRTSDHDWKVTWPALSDFQGTATCRGIMMADRHVSKTLWNQETWNRPAKESSSKILETPKRGERRRPAARDDSSLERFELGDITL